MNMKRALRFVASPVALSLLLGAAVATSTLYISTAGAQAQPQGSSSRSEVVNLTGFNANSNVRPQGTTQAGSSVDDFAPSTQPGETNGAVGGCNSVKGCKTLKKACLKLKDHEYKPASDNGSSGVCINNKQPTNQESSSSSGVSVNGGTLADVPRVTRDSFCHSKELCKELKLACQGTYEKLAGNSGVCRD